MMPSVNVYLILVFILLLDSNAFTNYRIISAKIIRMLYRTSTNTISQQNSFKLSMSSQNDNEPKPKNTKFQRTIDDFIGKRYGAGLLH